MDRNKGLRMFGFALGAGALLSAVGYLCYKASETINDDELSEACIYMAVMDDEVSRIELGGNFVDGEEIEFMTKRKSLKYRYDLFMDSNEGCSKFNIEREVRRLEKRVEASKKYADEFSVDFAEE